MGKREEMRKKNGEKKKNASQIEYDIETRVSALRIQICKRCVIDNAIREKTRYILEEFIIKMFSLHARAFYFRFKFLVK